MSRPGSDSPVEAYLDELLAESSTRRPRELRHLLAEAEAHLRDAAEAGLAEGLPWREAEARAVARFGSARDIAAAERTRLRPSTGALLLQAVMSAWLLGAIAAQAVGASGVIAAGIRLVGGERALVDVAPGRVLSAPDCARWLAISPGARSCHDAAVTDWAAETIFYRLAVGLLGVLALVGYLWLRRTGRRAPGLLPAVVTDTVALTLFAAAGMVSLVLGIDTAVTSPGRGWGQWLSAAPVALAAAAAFAARLLGDLRVIQTAAPLATIRVFSSCATGQAGHDR